MSKKWQKAKKSNYRQKRLRVEIEIEKTLNTEELNIRISNGKGEEEGCV